MKRMIYAVLWIFSTCAPVFSQIETADKIVVTVSDGWEANGGTMFLFDRTTEGWQEFSTPWPVSFGRNGMGWDDETKQYIDNNSVKKEGDNKSPAGILEFGSLYGFDSIPPEGVTYPYHQITEQTKCVDDGLSKFYNQIIEEDSSTKDWTSDENMHRIYPDYKYVLMVEHNAEKVPGNGSCIFFHINNMPTSGCTSMDEDVMVKFLRWLDPHKKVMLVQLPRAEYDRLKVQFHLPSLSTNQ